MFSPLILPPSHPVNIFFLNLLSACARCLDPALTFFANVFYTLPVLRDMRQRIFFPFFPEGGNQSCGPDS